MPLILYLSTRRSIYRIVHYARETASLRSLLLSSTLDETTLTTVSTNFVLTLHRKIDSKEFAPLQWQWSLKEDNFHYASKVVW